MAEQDNSQEQDDSHKDPVKPEYRDLCNFVIPHYMNNWKEIGIELGLRIEKLTAIEKQRLHDAQDCCYDMLKQWLQFDVNASWEKIKEVILSLSDINSIVPPSDLMVNFKQYLHKQYEQHSNPRIENAFICHQSKMPTRESVEAVAEAMYYGNIIINDDKCSDQLMLEPNQSNKYYEKCEKGTDILKLLTYLDSDPDREDPIVLFIEGAQGMGKTGICRNIAFQWAEHRGLHGESTLLLCLHDKNLEEINSLVAFLKHEYRDKPPATYETISKNLNNNEGKKVMFIIDGYERCLDRQKYSVDSFVQNILGRRVLQKCDLVISSCYTPSSLQHISYRIELLGFTETAKEQYIDSALNHDQRNIGELMDYLKEHRFLNSLCYNPLWLSSLVCLFQQSRQLLDIKLPTNQTEIINRLVNRIVLSLSGSEEKHFRPLTTAVGSMPEECQSALNTIGKLAFYSLKTNIVFKLSDIGSDIDSADAEKCCLNGLGFLKVVNAFENTDIYQMLFSFLHVSLQEFLAAFYVSTLSQSNHFEVLCEQTFWKSKFLNVWAHYCGITGDGNLKKMLLGSCSIGSSSIGGWSIGSSSIGGWSIGSSSIGGWSIGSSSIGGWSIGSSSIGGWSISSLSSWLGNQNLPDHILQNKIKCLYLVHCFTESPDNDIYQKVKPRVIAADGTIDLSLCNFTQEEFKIVILFLSRCTVPQWNCLDLSSCYIDDDILAYFFQQLQSFVTSISSMKVLNLSNNQLSKVSLQNSFKIATIFHTVEINLSYNQIEDQELCESVLSSAKSTVDHSKINIIQKCKSLYVLKSHNLLLDINLKLTATLSHLYIFKCSLKSEPIDGLISAVKSCNILSSIFFYDNNLLNSDVIKLFDGLKALQSLKSVLIFEKTSLDVQLYKIILFINDIPLASQASDHPLVGFLQLNDCRITDEVMSKIALILNSSSQHWSLLDLSDTNLDDNTLMKFCNALNGNCTVDTIKLANNKLTSLSLIVRLIQCLNPNTFDVCGNSFAMDNSNSGSVSMMLAKELFAHNKQLSLTWTCNNDTVLVCNQTAITKELDTSKNLAQMFVNKCTVSSEILLNNYNALVFLHLAHTRWDGEPLYNLTSFFEKNVFFSICENVIAGETLGYLVSKFDTNVNVSSIISTNDIFIANKCHFSVLKLHLIQKLSQLSSNVNLFYVRNCFLEHKPSIISDYLTELNMVTEIILCNNGLSRNSVCEIIKTLNQLQMPKFVFICELQKHLHGTKVARYFLHIIKCSFIIMENKVVIGNQVSFEQLNRCLRLLSPSTTVLRFISCSFGNEHYKTLVDILSCPTTLEEFSLFECNTNDTWTMQLVEALQVKSSLKSLLISCNRVTPLKVDSLTNALSTVIGNNPNLEKVSFKFNNLPSSACGKIFQTLSNLRHLKHFKFCDGQVTTKEAIYQLCKVIANNPSLAVINLRNNKLQSSGIKAIVKDFKNICNLKLLELSGNQIDEEAADDIASIIANNVKIEKLLLHNNALKSEGLSKICQALKRHKNLQAFCISKIGIQEEAADDIAEMVNHNSLMVFDVSHNRLLTKGVMQIAMQLSKLTTLLKLNLNDNNIMCTKIAAVCIAMIIMNNIMLISLHLDNNNFSVSNVSIIAKAINKLTGLRELTVNNTGFTADHISTMIANNLSLEILDIGDNKLKSEGIRNISKAVIKLSHLRVLRLCGNEIMDDAAGDIAGVINKLPVLEKLYLNKNKFGVAGIKSICESLQHKALKLLQLDDLGITEEVADDIAAVIDSNPLLECIYLRNNALHNTGAKVILNSLKNKKQFKALALNNNCISDDLVDNVVQFVISNPELEELSLNNNSIGATGVINICRCIKDINSLKTFNLTDNNVSNEATDAFVSVIESNTALEEISLDDNILFHNNVSSIITRLSNLRSLQINCKMVSENNYKSVNSIFANSNIEEIALKYLVEEMHFLSPVNTIETVVVIKANVSESDSHIPVLHSVVMEDRVEIVCTQDDVLVKSEVMKLINVKTFECLMLVLTRLNCFTDQEIKALATAIANYNDINSLIIGKLNTNKYNSDISGIVIIEGNKMMVLLTGDSLAEIGIIELLNKTKCVTTFALYTERMSSFARNISEIVDRTTKLEHFTLNKNTICLKAMENVFNCLIKPITLRTLSVKVLNYLNVRNIDFIRKSDKPTSQDVDEMDKNQWHDIFCALEHNVNLKTLDLSGNAINKEVAQYLSSLLNKITKIETLIIENCSLGMNLKYIALQNATTLKYLDLSGNNLTDDVTLRTILENNTKLKKLFINNNHLQLMVGDMTQLKNLEVLSIDQNIISDHMTLELFTTFSCRMLRIYNRHCQSTEAIVSTGLLHNITTLTLCKHSTEINNTSILSAILRTGVVLLLWQRDNGLNKARVFRLLSSFKITTIKLLNDSGDRLTDEEENTIASIIRENTQLENVMMGRCSHKSIVDDFRTFNIEHNIDSNSESKHHKCHLTLKIQQPNKPTLLSLNFLFKIVSALRYNANLRKLNLSGCPNDSITEELAEQLAIVLANSTKLETLLLEDCSLGNEGVNVIANSLMNIITLKLKHLGLSNNNITGYDQIAAILEVTTGLERLDLVNNQLLTTTGDKLSVAITNLKDLKVLNVDQSIICNNLITAFSAAVDRTLIIHNHDHQGIEVMNINGPLGSINTLTMCKFSTDDLGYTSVSAHILQSGTVLLAWSRCYIISTSRVLQYVSSSKQITTIKLLNISGSDLTEQEVFTIANVINENVSIKYVQLGSRSMKSIIDDFHDYVISKERILNHTERLAAPSKDNATNKEFFNEISHLFPNKLLLKILCALQNIIELRTLDLSGNVITEGLAEQLAIVLANSTKLETLLLEDCSLGNEGVNVIANSLKNITTLKYLNLSNNYITKEVIIVNIFRSNTRLKELHFHRNYLRYSAGDNISVEIINLRNLEVLSIDQNIISRNMALQLANVFTTAAKLFLYNHNHRSTEVVEIRGSFNNVNTLTLCKMSTVSKGEPMKIFILENGSAMLWWTKHHLLNTTGVLRFLSSLKKITTIKLLNNSGSELTELEVDTIATVISDNEQLENVWLGSQSVKTIHDDFVVLENTMPGDQKDQLMQLLSNGKSANRLQSNNKEMTKDKLQNQLTHVVLVVNDPPVKPSLNIIHALLPSILFALRCNTNLKTLDLSGNVITEELAEQLAIVLANSTKLETLLLEDCSLGNKGVNNSFKIINNALMHLNLSNNNITEELAIVNILKSNASLEELHFHRNYLQYSAGDNISVEIVNLKKLQVLSIDQNIISRNMALRLANTFTTVAKLFLYNRDHQSTEVVEIRGSFNNVNTLTLCKVFTVSKGEPMKTFILENRLAVLQWTKHHPLNITGVLRFLSSLKKITTIKLLNNSSSELTKLEVDTIATVISENEQLENVWLGRQSVKTIHDDFVVNRLAEDEKKEQFMQVFSNKEILKNDPQNQLTHVVSVIKDDPPVELNLNVFHKLLPNILFALRCNTNLKTLDLSGNVITEELAEQLAIVLANSTKLETLLLEDCSLGNEGVNVIANSLKNITTLKKLLLSWNSELRCLILKNYSLKVTSILKFEAYSKSIKSLTILKLRSNQMIKPGQHHSKVLAYVHNNKIIVMWSQDNILASTGILKVICTFKAFTKLMLQNKATQDYTGEDINEIAAVTASITELDELVMKSSFPSLQNHVFYSSKLTTLTTLNLGNSRIHTNALAKLLVDNSNIHELDLSHCLLTSSEVMEITNALKTHTSIKSLYFNSNNITNSADNISQVLLQNRHMQKFKVSNNRLQTRNIIKILEALKHLHKLNVLSIGMNNITSNITLETERFNKLIVEVISNNKELQVLGIGYVCIHGDEAAKVVKALKSLTSLMLLEMAGNNINEAVADDIADMISSNPNLMKLFIANNYLATAGIVKICEALVSLRGLEVLDIANNNIFIEAAESISKIIKNSPQLKVLLLGEGELKIQKTLKNTNSNSCSDISTSSILINEQMLEIKHNTKIYDPEYPFKVCIKQSSYFCCKLLSENLPVGINSSHLANIYYNKLQSEGIKCTSKALATIKSLEVLSIENNDVDDEAADDIAAALARNTGIKQLWIGQNHFTPSGISTILQALLEESELTLLQMLFGITYNAPKPSLEVLDLSQCKLSLGTASLVAEVLSKNNEIKQLWLEGNNLSLLCIITIADALKKCANISVLSLRDNNISEVVADILSEALSKNSNLQQLYLGNNHLQDRGVIKITEALNTTEYLLTLDLMNNNISEAAADALASVITSCSQLEQLYLGDNKLRSTGTIKITRALQQAKCRSTLRVLDLCNNRIGSDETVGDEISKAVGNTEILTVLILDDNAISVDGVWKITRSLSKSAEYMMIFSVMRNDVMISEETKDEMRALMAGQQPDCAMYL